MSVEKSNLPRLAIWLSRHARPGGDTDTLTGDLIERFREGQSRGWFWRQVLIALAVRVLGIVWGHWPHFCYAVAGTVLPISVFLSNAVNGIPGVLHWWALPWPWSQVVSELTRPAILALAALPVLAAGLVMYGAFRWVSLLRTGIIQLALLTISKYLSDAFGPWLTRPIPGFPYGRASIFPPILHMLLFFSTFLVAAWLGCRPLRDAAPADKQAENEAS
jgi:hypothetical protein